MYDYLEVNSNQLRDVINSINAEQLKLITIIENRGTFYFFVERPNPTIVAVPTGTVLIDNTPSVSYMGTTIPSDSKPKRGK